MGCADVVFLAGPFLGIVVNAAVQTIGARTVAGIELPKSVVVGFLAGLAAAAVFEAVRHATAGAGGMSASIAAGNAVVYGALSYCYFHFVNLGETARRIRIMREIHRSNSGLDQAGILARYDSREIVDNRLRRLMKSAWVEERGARLHAPASVLLSIANAMARFDRFLAPRSSNAKR